MTDAIRVSGLVQVRWVGSHLALALVGGAAVLLGALGLGLTAAADRGEPALIARVLVAGLAHVTAVWVTAGVAAALFGLAPRLAALGWALLAFASFAALLGDTVDLPEGVRNLSPVEHVPALPGGDVTVGPLAALLVLGAVLVAVGSTAFRRRDVNVT